MRLGRFLYGNEIVHGIVAEKDVQVIDNLKDITPIGETIKLSDLKFFPPTEPSKIICVGLNYRDHARELRMQIPAEPIIFIKPQTAALGHEGSIIYPKASRQVDYEAELAVVIGERCRDVPRGEAHEIIWGYTVFNDVTARDLQKKDGQWTRAKSFDTFAPFGPYMVTKNEIRDPHKLDIKSFLNGEKKQDSNTKNLIFDIPALVEFISGIMTLNPGDVIATGTPSGVGAVNRGDVIEIEIEDIGTLRNYVK